MQGFLVRRIAYSLLTIVGATIVVFALSRMAGDPRYLYLSGYGKLSEDRWKEWGREMGLDKPLAMQYAIWLGKAVRGDWGDSIVNGRPAFDAIVERLPATLRLAAGATVFALLFGIPLGVLSAVKRGSFLDVLGRGFAVLGQSLPAFWTGIVFILLFAVTLGWLPAAGSDGPSHYILPSVTMGWIAAAGFLRLTRSAMLEVLNSEYVKFARAKGASNTSVIWKHALRNAIISPLTFGGLVLAGFLAAGSVVVEAVFGWPGIGLLALDAVRNNDFPVLTGTVLVFAVVYVVIAFAVDTAYAFIDPRIRYG